MRETQSGLIDGELLRRIRERDEGAMAAVYDKYSRLVYTVGLRVLQDVAAAEDLTHDIFLGLWKKPVEKISDGGLAPWLAVVARNRAIDVIRRRKFTADVAEDSPALEPSVTPRMEEAQLAGRARTAIAALGAEQREALELAYFEGLSHSEIAARTGVPLGTIKTRIRAGLQSLRKEFHC